MATVKDGWHFVRCEAWCRAWGQTRRLRAMCDVMRVSEHVYLFLLSSSLLSRVLVLFRVSTQMLPPSFDDKPMPRKGASIKVGRVSLHLRLEAHKQLKAMKLLHEPAHELRSCSLQGCHYHSLSVSTAIQNSDSSAFGIAKLLKPLCPECSLPFYGHCLPPLPGTKEEWDDQVSRGIAAVNVHKVLASLAPFAVFSGSPSLPTAALLHLRSLSSIPPLTLAASLFKPVIVSQLLLLPLSSLPSSFFPSSLLPQISALMEPAVTPKKYFIYCVIAVQHARILFASRHLLPSLASFSATWEDICAVPLPLPSSSCGCCGSSDPADLAFPCGHSFCLTCFWSRLLSSSADSPLCPCCSHPFTSLAALAHKLTASAPPVRLPDVSPSQAAARSLAKFEELPEFLTVKSVKASKKKKENLTVVPNRYAANLLFSGTSQLNRSEKFAEAIVLSSHLRIAALIDAGVDVNFRHSEYGNGGLHVAIERGGIEAVRVLLEGGADSRKCDAVFGVTPAELCHYLFRMWNLCENLLPLFPLTSKEEEGRVESRVERAREFLSEGEDGKGEDVTTLVFPTLGEVLAAERAASGGGEEEEEEEGGGHPSRGATVVDGVGSGSEGFMEEFVRRTIRMLPVAEQREKVGPCSRRFYW